MEDDGDVGIEGAEPAGGGVDLRFADGGGVVEDLALEVVEGDGIEIGQPERADTGGGEVEGGGAAEAAGADDEHAGGGEPALAGEADGAEQEVPAVAREFLGREDGRRRGHGAKERRAGGSRK